MHEAGQPGLARERVACTAPEFKNKKQQDQERQRFGSRPSRLKLGTLDCGVCAIGAGSACSRRRRRGYAPAAAAAVTSTGSSAASPRKDGRLNAAGGDRTRQSIAPTWTPGGRLNAVGGDRIRQSISWKARSVRPRRDPAGLLSAPITLSRRRRGKPAVPGGRGNTMNCGTTAACVPSAVGGPGRSGPSGIVHSALTQCAVHARMPTGGGACRAAPTLTPGGRLNAAGGDRTRQSTGRSRLTSRRPAAAAAPPRRRRLRG